MEKQKIKPGMVVKYRNRKMTVEVVGPDYAVCVWVDGNKKGKGLFDFDKLKIYSL